MLCSKCKKRPAVVFLSHMEGDQTVNEGLCLQCAKEAGIKPVSDLMRQMGISDDDIDTMNDELMSLVENIEEEGGFEIGGAQTFPFLQNLFKGGSDDVEKSSKSSTKSADKKKKAKDDKSPKYKYLANYCDNLTGKAREGKLDRIIGRDKEIYRTIQILNRRTKNNPCLIGEPGVGKTAIAEGIAIKIANGDVPSRLKDKEIFLLDLTALVAGTQFRGQFESRVKGLVDEVKSFGNIILFIDEVHNLVGAGDSSEGSMNAANLLKPSLSRGEIQVIGATTFNEYRKYIEKDSALERRFQPVTVEEQSIAEATEILMGIKEYYENHHKVQVSEELIKSAVVLSERFVTDRFLPDKAIDLLDEACSARALKSPVLNEYDSLTKQRNSLQKQIEELEGASDEIDYAKLAEKKSEISRVTNRLIEIEPEAVSVSVTEDDIANVIELWTGIPATKIRETELKKVARLGEKLSEKIIGQDEAVELVSSAVRRSKVKISPRLRPASFIFVGPTGVGKTELVKVLASELFDTADPLIRLDMSEFMEKHSVSRIIGSPPGYVGYDDAGQLTEKVRRKPYSVVLFDEIEKAHPDIMNILLQILDEGKVTDAHGKTVSFQNTVIVMTSNAGSDKREGVVGFNKTAGFIAKEKAEKALSEFLRPEFISRVDEVVVFNPLTLENYGEIAKLMLSEFNEPMQEKGIKFSFDDKATSLLAKKSFGGKYGARDLRRTIRKDVEDKLAVLIAENYDNIPSAISITAEGDDLKIEHF